MGEEERRRCCLLGGCGCGPPGSAAQRQALQEWLTAKIAGEGFGHTPADKPLAEVVSGWLDELPWERVGG